MQTLDQTVLKHHGKRALERCQSLAGISEMDGAILRQYLTPEHKRCNQLVAIWMAEAGMDTWQDEVGNQWGRLASDNPDAKRLVIGSHLDTVPNAGAFDGILGVLLAIELADIAHQQGINLPFHLDIVGFCDEEGTRFATTLIGSKALAGNFDPSWLDLTDANGVSMSEALTAFGLSPKDVGNATLTKDGVLGYLEVHIEQGPVLEAADQALGVVSAIAGAKRAVIEFIGQSDHAGTTPMDMRKDTIVAAAELTIAIEQIAKQCQHNEVATVGYINAKPGVANVISGYSAVSLDARAQSDDDLELLLYKISRTAKAIASERQLELNWQWTHEAETVACDTKFQQQLLAACHANGEDSPVLPSGAGHDAMAIAPICPVGMLFIRSPGGISHHPAETVIPEDVEKALAVMYSAISSID